MKALTLFNVAFVLGMYAWTGYLVGYANMFHALAWVVIPLLIVAMVVGICLIIRRLLAIVYNMIMAFLDNIAVGFGH